MTTDGEQTVPEQEPTSQEEQVSQTEGQQQESAPEPAALTEEKVQQMIAEATARAVQEAKEAGRRELQSQQDRNKAEIAKAERRARVAEDSWKATEAALANVDPDAAKEIELARLRAERDGRNAIETETETLQQREAYIQSLKDSMAGHLESMGIAKDDSRVDWASDEADYLKGRTRFDASVAKILKENKEAENSAFEKRLKELEAKVNATDTEANSVETTTSGGMVNSSDAEFLKKFGSGDLPVNKENVDRYNKLINQ